MANQLLVEILRRYFRRSRLNKQIVKRKKGHPKEHLYNIEKHQQKPTSEDIGQPFVNVMIYQEECMLSPPDAYVMAYETGLNLVGISVALNTYSSLLNSGDWVYFTPMLYFDQYTYSDYSASQKEIFEALAQYIPLAVVDLQQSSEYMGTQGLNMQTTLLVDQLTAISTLQVNAMRIYNKLHYSKEFTYIEFKGNDPVYSNLQLNNVAFKKGNNNFDKTSGQMGVNQNVFYEPRFHEQIKTYAKKYDYTTKDSDIFAQNNITLKTTALDALSLNWDGTGSDRTLTDTGISFTFNVCMDRTSYTNLLLEYENGDGTIIKYLFIDNSKIEQFFRATSQFIIQPMITGFLYNIQKYETDNSDLDIYDIVMYPSPINSSTQEPFINYMTSTYNFGDYLTTGTADLMLTFVEKKGIKQEDKYSVYWDGKLIS